jgi:hypothetical protein
VYRQNNQLRHKEVIPLDDQQLVVADHPLKYLVGSGRFSRTYLAETDGFLVESPLTWYTSLNRWAMSPGYDRADHQSYHRVANFDCVYCHAGVIKAEHGSIERFAIHETAIGCERCHGPGALHAVRRSALDDVIADDIDHTIVNPRRLARELAEAICHQCHLESRVRVSVRGRRRGEFRPGLPWQDYYVNYTAAGNNTNMTVTGHVEQLQQSRCYQESGSLTCITCHDVHAETMPTGTGDPAKASDRTAIARWRDQCLSCHESQGCKLAPLKRTEQNQDNCVTCHMPNSATDIPHIAFTHHRIGIHGVRQQGAQPADTALQATVTELEPVLELPPSLTEPERIRMLGLAYYTLYRDSTDDSSRNTFLAKAESLLQVAASGGFDDASVANALGEATAVRGDQVSALRWARRARQQPIVTPEDHLSATDLVAQIQLRQREFGTAATSLEYLTKQRLYPADWFLLAVCRQREGNLAAARLAFQRVLEIDAGEPEIHDAWATLLNSMGDPAAAELHANIAVRLREIRAARQRAIGPTQQ